MQMTYQKKDGSFRLTFKKCESNNMEASHTHDNTEFYILLSGKRNLFVNDRFFEITEGGMFTIKPNTSHRTLDAESKDYECLICNISKDWMHAVSENTALLPEQEVRIVHPHDTDRRKITELAKEIRESLNRKDKVYEFSVCACVLRLLSIFFQYENIAQERTIQTESYVRISRIIRYIHTHFDQKLSLSELAERFFISEFYMCRLFKAYTGKTVGEYIASVRIEKACKMLVETDEQIRNIYTACGFHSLSNFNKSFKTICGKTPMQYRKGR